MATWYRGIALHGPGSNPSNIHDLGPGTYLTDVHDVARDYAKFRSKDANEKGGRTAYTTYPVVLHGDFHPNQLGAVLDLTSGPHGAAWAEFENGDGGRNRELLRFQKNYGPMFQQWAKDRGINLDHYAAIIGPEYLRGGRQLVIRDQLVAERTIASMRGAHESVHRDPLESTPENITFVDQPHRARILETTAIAIFTVIDGFSNYINDRYQGNLAQTEIDSAINEVRRWQVINRSDGALIVISFSRRVPNDASGVVKRGVYIHAGDKFEGVDVIYAPNYYQAVALSRKRQHLSLPDNSNYAIEFSENRYWIEPLQKSPPAITLISPVGWWVVRIKPNYTWYYQFKSDGTVRWTDPGTRKSGEGKWVTKKDSISISWNPPSKSIEDWDLPLYPNGQGGTATWAGGAEQDLRAEFGVTPPASVTAPQVASPAGQWWVWVDKDRFWWEYSFDVHGNVSWADKGAGMSGSGKWKFSDDYLVINWSSGSVDKWDTPLDPTNSIGTAIMKGKSYNLRAKRK